jgi:hypothetical protein
MTTSAFHSLVHFLLIPTLTVLFLSCNSQFSECEYGDTYGKGVSIFFMQTRNSFNIADFTENLYKLKSIGINTLFLSPSHFTPNSNATAIDSTSETLPDSELCQAIVLAKSQGFTVVLKPHINCTNDQPRYMINPYNYPKWLALYKHFILHYLSIAETYKLSSFVIATELDNVVEHDEFISFCDSIRASTDISIIYSSSFNQFVNTKLWQHVDVMGINAYFNLDNSLPPSPNTMHETWNYWLNLISQYSSIKRKSVIITEVGYMSRNTAAKNPGDFSGDKIKDFTVQKECYEALLSQAGKFEQIKSIIFWQWELGRHGDADSCDYTPRDKPAETVLKKYWAGQ